MGLLDALRGKKPKLSIAVDPADALPGDEVRVRVVVEGEIDDKAEGGRAGIRCVNEYLKREYDRREEEWEQVWRAVSLHEDAQDLPLATGEHELAFRIPEGLPPDSSKAVSWWAFASIARRRGLDATASTRIAVRLPESAAPSERRSVPATEDGVAFEDVPASAGAGRTVDGTLSFTPTDEVKTTGVRVKLTRTCTYTADDQTIVKSDTAGEAEIAPGQTFPAGQRQQFSFSLPVPPNPGPTAQAPHTVVEWTVTGIVARRMRGDLEVKAPIVVYDG